MTGRLPALAPERLWVAEHFASLQGEGPSMGRPAAFVRLAGCHLSCQWCDTAYTWDESRFDLAQQRQEVGIGQLTEWILSRHAPVLVITGGEPLLQQDKVVLLLQSLRQADFHRLVERVEVETSGTIIPRHELVSLVSTFNVSPKLAHAGMAQRRRLRPEALSALAATGRTAWKFVVRGPQDLDEVAAVLELVSPGWGAGQATGPGTGAGPSVWIMPEGTEAGVMLERLTALVEPVLARGWNLAPRLHVLLWGDERGR